MQFWKLRFFPQVSYLKGHQGKIYYWYMYCHDQESACGAVHVWYMSQDIYLYMSHVSYSGMTFPFTWVMWQILARYFLLHESCHTFGMTFPFTWVMSHILAWHFLLHEPHCRFCHDISMYINHITDSIKMFPFMWVILQIPARHFLWPWYEGAEVE